MIDLLLHMSEIYGKPNETGVQNLHQVNDEDEELTEDVDDEYHDHRYGNDGDEDHLGSESTDRDHSDDPYAHNNGSMTNGVHSNSKDQHRDQWRVHPFFCVLSRLKIGSEEWSFTID
jgi:hypothetical protein